MENQNLILPLTECQLTASWLTEAYQNWTNNEFEHFGIDLISTKFVNDVRQRDINCSGYGTVVDVGKDGSMGNIVIILYPSATNRITKETIDVIFRYCHLGTINVRKGQQITKNTIIGNYGKVANNPMSPHLHLEIDTDIEHPYYTPSIKLSTFLKRMHKDLKMPFMSNPLGWLYCSSEQVYTTTDTSFIRTEDKDFNIDRRPLNNGQNRYSF